MPAWISWKILFLVLTFCLLLSFQNCQLPLLFTFPYKSLLINPWWMSHSLIYSWFLPERLILPLTCLIPKETLLTFPECFQQQFLKLACTDRSPRNHLLTQWVWGGTGDSALLQTARWCWCCWSMDHPQSGREYRKVLYLLPRAAKTKHSKLGNTKIMLS